MRRVIALILLAAGLSGRLTGWVCADDCDSVRQRASAAGECHGSADPDVVVRSSHDCMGDAPVLAPAVATRHASNAATVLAPGTASVGVPLASTPSAGPVVPIISASPPLFRAVTPLRI
jgi:hypothetical protein